MSLEEAPMSSGVGTDVTAVDDVTTVFRAYERAEFLEWPAWKRLHGILRANGGSYGLSGPRGAGKTWLMLRAIEWIEAGEDKRRLPGIGLWYPSPSEYDSLAFLASLSDSLGTTIERWYQRSPAVRERLVLSRIVVGCAAAFGVIGALILTMGRGAWELGRSHWVPILLLLAGAVGGGALGYIGVRVWKGLWPERRLLREAQVLQERARYSATQRRSSEVGGEGGRGVVATVRRISERELVERPATLSSLVNDFRALAAEAGAVTGGVVIAIDELDKMSDPEGVRKLLRDIKAIFEVPRVHFLVSVSDEAARDLSLGALIERNEFNSSFYTVVRAQPATPADCAELLERRGNVPREVSLVLAVLAGGNPREVVRLAELAGPATTGVEATMAALGEEALALRREVVTATSMEGMPELGQAAREAAFLALPDEAFERPDDFVKLCASALDGPMWAPSWADQGWTARFQEAWRRLMVRLAVAGQLAAAQSIVREVDLTDRLLDVVAAGGQSSQVAKTVLERKLRIDKRSVSADGPTQDEVREELTQLARRYESTRATMKSGAERTNAMDDIAHTARRLASESRFGTDEIRALLASERPGDRVVALAIVQAAADPGTFGDVLNAVKDPKTPFEQFQALRALESLRTELDPQAQAAVHEVLTDPDWRAAIGKDASRLVLADRILGWLEQDTSLAR
jgi:hypothetical protein